MQSDATNVQQMFAPFFVKAVSQHNLAACSIYCKCEQQASKKNRMCSVLDNPIQSTYSSAPKEACGIKQGFNTNVPVRSCNGSRRSLLPSKQAVCACLAHMVYPPLRGRQKFIEAAGAEGTRRPRRRRQHRRSPLGTAIATCRTVRGTAAKWRHPCPEVPLPASRPVT